MNRPQADHLGRRPGFGSTSRELGAARTRSLDGILTSGTCVESQSDPVATATGSVFVLLAISINRSL